MADISAALVKQLRDTTGAGMMDAKKALVETNGDVEAAIVPTWPPGTVLLLHHVQWGRPVAV